MRMLSSTYESRGGIEPMVELAVRLRALGAEVRVRAAELVAAQFDTVAAAAEGCDALVAGGMMLAGV